MSVECRECGYWSPPSGSKVIDVTMGMCHYYPVPTQTRAVHWCGKFTECIFQKAQRPTLTLATKKKKGQQRK